MKSILFILTNYRVFEKYIGLIESMASSHKYNMTLYMMGQASLKTKWPGDIDLREEFVKKIRNCNPDVKIYQDRGIQYFGQSPTNPIIAGIQIKDYNLIWYDDNRLLSSYSIPVVFSEAKKLGIPMIGNSHGNQEIGMSNIDGINRSYDHLFVLGDYEKGFYKKYYSNIYSGGIPTNDSLKKYLNREGEYILCITNFLSNHNPLPFECNFDKKWAVTLSKLARRYNYPIYIKHKGRLDDPDYEKNIKFIYDLFSDLGIQPKVISDTDNIDELIANSKYVISAFSTLSFKSMQLKKPTILINGSGQIGNFILYPYTKDLDVTDIISGIEEYNQALTDEFLDKVLEGSKDFSAIDKYILALNSIIG